MRFWQAEIMGQPCSKSNSRQLVTLGGRWSVISGQRVRIGGIPRIIKSKEALAYEASVRKQVGVLRPLLQGRLRFTCKIYYASERPDLDASLILDALEGCIYGNDRAVREIHLFHRIDRNNPRCVVRVEEIDDLPLPATIEAKGADELSRPVPDFGRAPA